MEQLNNERPMVMHIDLNSCFATVEQQARPMLRGRPVAIVNRRTEKTAIVTASYEAKKYGVAVGMKLRDAQVLVPDIIALESDPAKYKYVYRKLLNIMNDYSAHVVMKSIDEGVIDFRQADPNVRSRQLEDIGMEIKQRLRDEVGIWMKCNIGIGANRFLAKTAAGLNKPDGLDVIDSTNLRQTFDKLRLTNLTGIAEQYQRRLNKAGICTPLEFLDAPEEILELVVFKGIAGKQWHQRLRGWEVDDYKSEVQRVGRQYVLEDFNLSRQEIVQRLHHLCESVGSRMRAQQKSTRGVYVYARTLDGEYWHASHLSELPFFSDQAIFEFATHLFSKAPDRIKEIGIHCYKLQNIEDSQLSIFQDEIARERAVTSTIDTINSRFGERTVHSADTLGTGIYVNTKVPFGSTLYL
jgi:DNA polymerase-4